MSARLRRRIAIAGALSCASPIFGQNVSFGFLGGTPLTRDFPISRIVFTDPDIAPGPIAFDWFSDKRTFLAGLWVEIDLGKGLSVEGNALHRTLHLQTRHVFQDGSVKASVEKTPSTWEWPVLVKYRPAMNGPVRQFVAAGPSFRTRHDPAPAEPSQFGGTLGAGIELRMGRFLISPGLRYTRWRYDGDYPRAATKRDQIEFLTGLSYATSVSSWRLGDRKLRLGVVGGAPLTGSLPNPSPFQRTDEEQGYIAGLALEWELSRRVSIEANGLYRPPRAHTYFPVDVPGLPRSEVGFEFTVLTWQFPILAKYRWLPESRIRPVFEAGPSLRAAGNLNGYNPSRYGFTAGGGIEIGYKATKISPVLRYTRWARDPAGAVPSARTTPNQVELLFSITF